jgi:cytochrome c peroxidase
MQKFPPVLVYILLFVSACSDEKITSTVAFANFSALENQGKTLFLGAPQFNANGERTGGGAVCQGCHRVPELDIDPNSRNNGVVGSTTVDLTGDKSPLVKAIK